MTNKPAQQMTVAERAGFLNEAREAGVVETCRKHGITSKTYYQWLARYQSGGVEALAPQKKAAENAELVSLRRENERLKRLLADKELALDIKDALLKKTSQRLANAAALPKNL
jgi:putative transposase